MADLVVHTNRLVGTIPASVGQLANLHVFEVQNNRLTGSIEKLFDPVLQPFITTIILNNNQLTGTLPAAAFTLKNLNAFAAVGNCFHGTLPNTLCHGVNLFTLVLDGLSSATSCRDELLPRLTSSYLTRRAVHGTIPSCLFAMPNLTTLHLSGNGLTGSLPADLTVFPAMYDLTLSHNLLTGHIPSAIQRRNWLQLDLSFNRFDGGLNDDFATVKHNFSIYRIAKRLDLDLESTISIFDEPGVVGNVSAALYAAYAPDVSLENNRLSGRIPISVQNLRRVSILGTNMFFCQLDGEDLPENDSGQRNYQCGSSAFDIPYYLWLVLCGICIAVLGAVVYWRGYFEQFEIVAAVLLCLQR